MRPHPHPPRPAARLHGILALGAMAAVAAVAGCPAGASAAAPAAFTGAGDPGLPALITSLRGCLTGLPDTDRTALTLRAGLDGHAPRLPAAVAPTFGRTAGAEAAAEVRAVRKLEVLHRRGACQAQAPAAARSRAPNTGAPAKSSSSTGTTGVLRILLPVLLALAFMAGISREIMRDPRT